MCSLAFCRAASQQSVSTQAGAQVGSCSYLHLTLCAPLPTCPKPPWPAQPQLSYCWCGGSCVWAGVGGQGHPPEQRHRAVGGVPVHRRAGVGGTGLVEICHRSWLAVLCPQWDPAWLQGDSSRWGHSQFSGAEQGADLGNSP